VSTSRRRAGEDSPTLPDWQKVKAGGPVEVSKQADLADRPRAVLLFERSDASVYCSLATLPQRAGVPVDLLRKLVAKEFTDNALDSADATGNPGKVEIAVDRAGNLHVADRGTGLADASSEEIARIFSVARPMVSSKLLRRPTRGCVGNGLRVCLGFLAATGGRLIVETGNVRVELIPDSINGTSRIHSVETIELVAGMRLTAIIGQPHSFTERDLTWAEDAIELAKRSGRPAFTGKPSLHWHDRDSFHVLLRSGTGGDFTVRKLLGSFDGCTGSKVQSEIAGAFLRRVPQSLNAEEAGQLLTAGQNATREPKATALQPLGRNAVIADAYAVAEGDFLEGEHEPHAKLKFLVEAWVDAEVPDETGSSLTGSIFINRTRSPVTLCGHASDGLLQASIGHAWIYSKVPAGPHYSVTVAITSPMYRMVSDGKAPDMAPFESKISEAVEKAGAKAGREIASWISAAAKHRVSQLQQHERERARERTEEKRISDRAERLDRQARREEEKARRAKERAQKISIKDAVLKLLPDAVKTEAASGHLFNTRRLLYRIRDPVFRLTGKELVQGTFDKLVTEIEAEQGDLHPLLIREPRGSYFIPHRHLDAIPLGTTAVRRFERPAWTFNKIIVIEKEDLRLMLEQAGWAQRHDALLMSSKGFNSRAARDLIDKIAETDESITPYSVHDADAAGTVIQHALQYATRARGARKIEIVDLGLQPWEGIVLDLPVEKVPPSFNKNGTKKHRPVGDYVKQRTDRAPNGETWEQWLQHSRIELNAFTSAELIAWLDRKMEEHDAGKLIPPDGVLTNQFSERVHERATEAVATALSKRLAGSITVIEAEQAEATRDIRTEIDRVTADLRTQLADVSAPFKHRIEAEQIEALAIDREALVHRTIEQITPRANVLRSAITTIFTDEPALHWATALHRLADAAEVSDPAMPSASAGGASP
jgi:DNA topoisomerase VI subunit A